MESIPISIAISIPMKRNPNQTSQSTSIPRLSVRYLTVYLNGEKADCLWKQGLNEFQLPAGISRHFEKDPAMPETVDIGVTILPGAITNRNIGNFHI